MEGLRELKTPADVVVGEVETGDEAWWLYLFAFFLRSILAKSSLQIDSGLAFTLGTFSTPLGVTN